jgi:hypothetical protein
MIFVTESIKEVVATWLVKDGDVEKDQRFEADSDKATLEPLKQVE